MSRYFRPLAALLFAGWAAIPGQALAADPTGLWLTADKDAKIRVTRCGNGICGAIAWLKDPNDASGKPKTDKANSDASRRNRPLIGTPIIMNMQPEGADKWSGKVYNAEDGKMYDASFSLRGANEAGLRGCLLIICKTSVWTRTN